MFFWLTLATASIGWFRYWIISCLIAGVAVAVRAIIGQDADWQNSKICPNGGLNMYSSISTVRAYICT